MRGFTRRIWPRPPVKPPRDYDEDEPATPPALPPVPPARSLSDNSAANCSEPGGRATGPTRASSQIARSESDDSKCYALANTPDDLADYDNDKDRDDETYGGLMSPFGSPLELAGIPETETTPAERVTVSGNGLGAGPGAGMSAVQNPLSPNHPDYQAYQYAEATVADTTVHTASSEVGVGVKSPFRPGPQSPIGPTMGSPMSPASPEVTYWLARPGPASPMSPSLYLDKVENFVRSAQMYEHLASFEKAKQCYEAAADTIMDMTEAQTFSQHDDARRKAIATARRYLEVADDMNRSAVLAAASVVTHRPGDAEGTCAAYVYRTQPTDAEFDSKPKPVRPDLSSPTS